MTESLTAAATIYGINEWLENAKMQEGPCSPEEMCILQGLLGTASTPDPIQGEITIHTEKQ